jgi:outer membrane protein W
MGALAQEGSLSDTFARSHQFGGRLGGWANRGNSPGDSVKLSDVAFYLTDFGNASFYAEGFFTYRMSPYLAAEFSLGFVNRGEVILKNEATRESFIGNLIVYPILAKAKVYPFGRADMRFHPFVMLGGGIYYGRHDVQIVSSASYYYVFEEDSQTALGWTAGFGLDWPLASVVALDVAAQYMPIDFSTKLIDVNDYSSLTITIGVKYLFHSTGKR